jgi:hypothetical protein
VNIVVDIPSRKEPFEPMDMPDLTMLLRMAEWHADMAAELASSGSDLAPFHHKAAEFLRTVDDYMRQLRAILTEDDEFFSSTSLGEPAN